MLTNARGSHWRRIRSAVSPAFTRNRTRRLYPLLTERARHFLRLIRSIQQEQHGPLTPDPTPTATNSTASKALGRTVTDTAELSGEDRVCSEKSQENGTQRYQYSEERISAEEAKEEAMEITTESKQVENASKYSKEMKTEEEAAERTNKMNESDISTLHEETQRAILARTTEAAAERTNNMNESDISVEMTPHSTTHTKHKQMDTPTPTPNELISTSPATDTGNTHVGTPRTTGKQRTQHRDKKHDTNNNSTKSTTAREDMKVQTDKQTHLKGTNKAATTPSRRNTATADDTTTRNRGGEKATREELKQKDDIEVSLPSHKFYVTLTETPLRYS